MMVPRNLSSPNLLAGPLTVSPDSGDLGGTGRRAEKQQRQGQENLGQDDRVTYCSPPRASSSPRAPGALCTWPSGKLPPAGNPLPALWPLFPPLFPCLRSLRNWSLGQAGAPLASEFLVDRFPAPYLVRVLFPQRLRPTVPRVPSPSTFMLPVQLGAAGCLLPQTAPQTAPAHSYVLGPGQAPRPHPLELQSPPLPFPAPASASTVRGAKGAWGGGAGPRGHLRLIRFVGGRAVGISLPTESHCSLGRLYTHHLDLCNPWHPQPSPYFLIHPPTSRPTDVCLFSPSLACVSSVFGGKLRSGGEGSWEGRPVLGAQKAGEAASELLMWEPVWGWRGLGAAGARQSPGKAGTFLSHERSLQASKCCLPQLEPGPSPAPFQPPWLWPPEAPFPLPQSSPVMCLPHTRSLGPLLSLHLSLPLPSTSALWPPSHLRLPPRSS